ncbi:MAG: hypothetical protein JNL72_12435 [Flavipsychrobacter sp.]|nr:hypothetical protein [Flavipsychrobacter sp.]
MNIAKQLAKYGLIVVVTGMVFSCRKKEPTTPEPTITIDIQSTVEGAVYQRGDTVQVKALVSSPVEVHGYRWTITKANGTVLHSSSDHVHGRDFAINGVYVNMVDTSTAATLQITVEVDHDGNQQQKSVSFMLQQ